MYTVKKGLLLHNGNKYRKSANLSDYKHLNTAERPEMGNRTIKTNVRNNGHKQ